MAKPNINQSQPPAEAPAQAEVISTPEESPTAPEPQTTQAASPSSGSGGTNGLPLDFAAMAQRAQAVTPASAGDSKAVKPFDPLNADYNEIEENGEYVVLDDDSYAEFEVVKAVREKGKANSDPTKSPYPDCLSLTLRVKYPLTNSKGEPVRDGIITHRINFVEVCAPIFKSLWHACDALDENGRLSQIKTGEVPGNPFGFLVGEYIGGKIKNREYDRKIKDESGVEKTVKATSSGIAWSIRAAYLCPEMKGEEVNEAPNVAPATPQAVTPPKF